ncbi:MAG TPA: ATP phosphoribosyltransferase [Persephonella sp.]|uniref:ATP phosphoribosyltransferase n=1 Tax=Persephonella marina (strain DSM 14350 / EX-H1) TaxID=123214 RepID=C0QR65_PERMH|nr:MULTISPECIES: ATP phosphoribosyltransferase [Persephonella]ACO03711.1 ATP phosphoribosyltransferase [Persephonella marina EX-H1]HCB68908.1 ATP phosphoribosyltransferase [Persephonella sp.]
MIRKLNSNKLTVALPKGRLFDQTIDIFRKAGILKEEINSSSRKLIIESGDFYFLLVRAKDVPTYVENGIADIGVAGDDVLIESDPDVYRPVDLNIGVCSIVVAGLPESKEKYFSNPTSIKVSTKYPKVTKQFFGKKGVKVHIIELYGSVELAPLVGLSDYIVDIVETGRTLRENGLVVIEHIRQSSAKLIVNRISYKTRKEKLFPIIEKLHKFLDKGE